MVDATVTSLKSTRTYVDCDLVDLRAEDAPVNLTGLTFESCRFQGGALRLAVLDDATFDNCDFLGCDLMGTDWCRAHWPQFALSDPLRFVECRLDYATFHGLRLDGTVFHGCSMIETDLAEASLIEADLRHCDLSSARLNASDCSGADLRGAFGYALDPRATELSGAQVSLPEAGSILHAFGMEIGKIDARLEPSDFPRR